MVNPWTAEALGGLGAGLVWASPELSGRQLAALAAASPAAGRRRSCSVVSELMVAEHCVISAGDAVRPRCDACARRSRRWRLRDQKGYEFPVTTDASGRSHVYNSVTLDLSRSVRELLDARRRRAAARPRRTRPPDEAAEAVARVARACSTTRSRADRRPRQPLVEPATSGHFYRGVR